MKQDKRFQIADKKARELLLKMTLTEKIGQMSQYGESIYQDSSRTYEELYKEGKVGSYLGFREKGMINRIQREIQELDPNKIPAIMGLDVIHGFKTNFPAPIAQACSWNPKLTEKICAVQAKEAYSEGVRWTFAPMVDVARDARWGRIMESFGEDTYLSSEFAKAAVLGYQGKEIGSKDHVIACMKHFAGYGAAERGLDYNGVRISKEDMLDLYLPPFKAAVDAGVGTAMSAFHEINGIACASNKWLLTDILRKKWKFNGFVVSDYGSIEEMVNHGVVKDEKEATLVSIKAGHNMHMAGGLYNQYVPELIKEGKLTEDEIDKRVLEVLRLKFLIEEYMTDENAPSVHLLKESRELAREAIRETCVLIENDGILPLSKQKKQKIALIGPAADAKMDMYSTWNLICDKRDVVSILDASKEAFPKAEIRYCKGCEYEGDSQEYFEEAKEVAAWADVVILALGETRLMTGENRCRTELEMPGMQEELAKLVHSVNPNVVSVIISGRPNVIGTIVKNSRAVLYSFIPGVEAGHGICDLLNGTDSPKGRLAVSLPNTTGSCPCAYNRNNTGRPYVEGINWRTRYLDTSVESKYMFGHGLTYTTFEYKNAYLAKEEIGMKDVIEYHITLENTGKRAGVEVAQLYIWDKVASRARPIRQLKAYQRVSLKPGQSRELVFKIKPNELGFTNSDLKYVVEPGEFEIWVGKRADDRTNVLKFELK